jgi:hypothetical protein
MQTGTKPQAGDARVRACVCLADRRRRRRDASEKLWRTAPAMAAAGLAAAVVSRLAGWSPAVPLTLLAVGVIGLSLYAYSSRRPRAVSDGVATIIDAEAGLAGELRSARWFAEREVTDAWSRFHLDRAANRLQGVEWTTLYPPVRARRARMVTGGLAIATLAIAIAEPFRDWVSPPPPPHVQQSSETAPAGTIVISPELQKQLEALLQAAERGTIPADRQSASAQDVRELLDALAGLKDADALKELARALDEDASGGATRTAQQLTTLAERAKRAAAMAATPPDVREALERLANDLSRAAAAEQLATAESQETAGVQEGQQAVAAKEGAAAGDKTMSIQFAKDASDDAGSMVIMMSSQGGGTGDAQPGVGPGGDAPYQHGTSKSSDLAQALRRETVEASDDDPGQSVPTDARRKTEQARAAVSFTGGEAGTFDRSRASAPPTVPESRRRDVRAYFIRKP